MPKACKGTALVLRMWIKAVLHIGAVAFIHRFGSSLESFEAKEMLRYCARPPFFLSVGFVVTAVDFSHSALDTAHALKLQRGMALLTQCVYLADFDVSPLPDPDTRVFSICTLPACGHNAV